MTIFIQYRLDLFGFMSLYNPLTHETIGGNYGLMDQQMAIKFVHDHAFEIGGDKTKIAVMGQSGGAMSTSMHLLHPESSKFFIICHNFKFASVRGTGPYNNISKNFERGEKLNSLSKIN